VEGGGRGRKWRKGEGGGGEREKETNVDDDGILDVGDVLVLTLSDLNLKAVRRRGSASEQRVRLTRVKQTR
jgi:hypothetical protein